MTTTRNPAALELDRAQQQLSRLLMAEDRDAQAIAEAAPTVRKAERRAIEAERRR